MGKNFGFNKTIAFSLKSYNNCVRFCTKNYLRILPFLTRHRIKIIFAVLIVGIILRYLVTLFGHNFDLDSYEIVGKIVTSGGNVYAETNRYNYGPIWSWVIGLLYGFGNLLGNPFLILRYGVTTLLTFTDMAIAAVIGKKMGTKYALLFFLNPISIIISGFHGQFDNLAILIALIAVIYISDNSHKKFWGIFLLGISLSVKHIFFLLPLWLAVKEKRPFNKFIVLTAPVVIFLLLFAPYWQTGGTGIIENVFLYKSFNNAPLWNIFIPDFLARYISPMVFFVAGLALMGIFVYRESRVKSFLIYLGAIFIFSSAVANQYLVIPVIFAIFFINPFTLLFLLWATIKLLIDGAGLNISFLADILPSRLFSYTPIVVIFTVGFAWAVIRLKKDEMKKLKFLKAINKEVKAEVT